MKRYQQNKAQIDGEFARFVELLKSENVKSYLEVGSQYGGALWQAANALPKGSRVVSVDLPHGDQSTAISLKECVEELRKDYDAHLHLGDSTHPDVIEWARKHGPFDCVFIDANHSLPFVTKDWENFGPLGRMVALHDIVWDRPVRPGRVPIEVSKLWRQIKGDHQHLEIIEPGSEKGIGVLWR